jgi:hypothetical protein
MSAYARNHHKPSKHDNSTTDKQHQAQKSKRNSNYIRSGYPAAQSHDEFADTLGVFLRARSNDANSHA